MYKTIVFDLDGTLLDTLDDLTDGTNAALEKFGLKQRTKEEVRGFVGNGAVKLMERAAGNAENVTTEALVQAFNDYYGVHCEDKTKPYEGILELLKKLKEKGIYTAVLSNKPDYAVKKLAKRYFGDLLEMALGENEAAGIRKKPAPDALFAVMKACNADKASTVFVGDSEVDIQTAKNAGIDCISVSWGFKTRNFLLENGATKLAEDAAALEKYCLS